MADKPFSLESHLSTLDERIERLGRMLSPSAPAAPSRRTKSSPSATVRSILIAFTVAAVLMILGDVVAVFFLPDHRVFVGVEGREFQIWSSAQAYEAGTGKDWIDMAPKVDLLATYHGARKEQALGSIGIHVVFLALSIIALRAVKRIAAGQSTEPIAAADGEVVP
jgi:amino acid transporter